MLWCITYAVPSDTFTWWMMQVNGETGELTSSWAQTPHMINSTRCMRDEVPDSVQHAKLSCKQSPVEFSRVVRNGVSKLFIRLISGFFQGPTARAPQAPKPIVTENASNDTVLRKDEPVQVKKTRMYHLLPPSPLYHTDSTFCLFLQCGLCSICIVVLRILLICHSGVVQFVVHLLSFIGDKHYIVITCVTCVLA